jgi:phosphatidylserine decarboxylase
LSVYPLNENSQFYIKGSYYSVTDLTNDKEMEEAYKGGYCFAFRLTVDDYHRYCYIDDGRKEENVFIPGVLHTVNPISLGDCNIYGRNSREYTILHTENFGDVLQVEVGALLVGRISNHHQEYQFTKGEEKGMFEFGGSTIVLLTKKNFVIPSPHLLEHTEMGVETIVKMGECLS